MKTHFQLSLIFILLLLAYLPTAIGQQRPVVWIHGMSSSSDYWRGGDNYPLTLRNNFPRMFNGFSLTPNVQSTSSIGVDEFAESISGYNSETVNNLPIPPDASSSLSANGIGVAHSMGGLALRSLDLSDADNREKYGGIITVGSPLDGAQVVNSYYDGTFSNMVYRVYSKITAPLHIANTRAITEATGDVITGIVAAGLLESAGYLVLRREITEMIGGSLPSGRSRNDLMVGGGESTSTTHCTFRWVRNTRMDDDPHMYRGRGRYASFRRPYRRIQTCRTVTTRNRNLTSNTPKVHIVGEEFAPIVPNVLEAISPNFANTFHTVRSTLYTVRNWTFFWDPYLAFRAGGAADYMSDGINVDYARIIGALRMERRHRLKEVPQRLWNCFYQQQRSWSRHCGWFSWLCGWLEDIVNVLVCAFRTIFVETLVGYDVPIVMASDGVVPASSQRGDGSRWRSRLDPVVAEGVSHSEMNGHADMRRAFERIFRGNAPGTSNDRIFFNVQ